MLLVLIAGMPPWRRRWRPSNPSRSHGSASSQRLIRSPSQKVHRTGHTEAGYPKIFVLVGSRRGHQTNKIIFVKRWGVTKFLVIMYCIYSIWKRLWLYCIYSIWKRLFLFCVSKIFLKRKCLFGPTPALLFIFYYFLFIQLSLWEPGGHKEMLSILADQ